MRKILFILATITLMTVGVNAQVMEIYNGNTLIKTYTQEQADRVVFEKPPIIKVTSIIVTGSKKEINVGESLQLSATIFPSNATNKSVTWSSSNTSVATVSSSGLVKAVKAGSATISATAKDGSGVKGTYILTVNTHNGHEYVDLGLPSGLKWATCNVGATTPEGYGDYFAWGATSPLYESGYAQENPQNHWKAGKSDGYCFNNTPYQTKNTTTGYYAKWTKYVGSTLSSYKDPSATDADALKKVLDYKDDAAYKNWGGAWRMPTKADQDELREKCTWTWTTQGNVKGYKVTGPSGNSIFLPAAGYRYGTVLDDVGSYVNYWSSSLGSGDPSSAYVLIFTSEYIGWRNSDRYHGYSVRAVCQ